MSRTNPYELRGGARPGAGKPYSGRTISVLLRLRRETVVALGRHVKRMEPGDRYGAKSRLADDAISKELGIPLRKPDEA